MKATLIALVAVLVVVIAVVTAERSHTKTTLSAGRVRATVVLLGDSNVVLSAAETDKALLQRDDGYLVVDTARPGSGIRFADCDEGTGIPIRPCRTYDYWQHRVADVRAAIHPSAWFIDLGINDASKPGTTTSPGYANYGTKIDWLLGLLGNVPVLWANLPCQIEPRTLRTGCDAVDEALNAAVKRHSNLRVLDWAKTADRHASYLGAPLGVHLTAAGRAAWAQFVSAKLDATFGRP